MMDIVEAVKKYADEDWSIRARRLRGKIYVSARKSIDGKLVEKGIGYVTESELQQIAGYIKKKPRRRARRTPTTTNTTTQQSQSQATGQPSQGGVGGQGVGRGCVFMIHRLGLRFIRPWVSPLFIQQLGDVRYVERSKQWILKMEVGVKRFLTLQVNKDGTAQVFLEASDNPLSVEEFIGFCKFMLLEVFRKATGKQVSLKDFEVMAAPEINCDLDGVRLMEGVKSLTLQDYYEDVVRIYYSEPGVKETMPNGGTRVEVRASSLNGYRLDEVIDGVVSMAKLPVALAEIKKDLELIKGSVPLKQLEFGQLSEAIATRLGNLIYATFEKWGNKYELALKELGSKLNEALKPLFIKMQQLEKENQELKKKLQELMQQDSSLKFDDLPDFLKDFLKQLEKDSYIRLTETRISYGDKVWRAIFRLKGNIDMWINNASYDYYGKEDNRELFKAVIKAIRFYDNKYNGRPGVPYDKFMEALEKFLGSEVTDVTEGYTHNQKEKRKTKQLTLFMQQENKKQTRNCCPYLYYGMCKVAPPGVDPRAVFDRNRCCGAYNTCNFYKRAKLNNSDLSK